MELLVGALLVFAFLAVLTRFVMRDATGAVRLPRIVDDSIGMWLLRRMTGRPLGQRPSDEDEDDPAVAGRAQPPDGGPVGGPLPGALSGPLTAATPRLDDPAAGRPLPPVLHPAPLIERAAPQWRMTAPDAPAPPAARIRLTLPWRRVSAAAGIAALGVFAAIAVGSALTARQPVGTVLGDQRSPAPSTPAASARASARASATPRATAPVAAIVSVSKAAIPGHTVLLVSVTWSITTHGSALKAQLFQWRTDDGPWVTVRLPSLAARTVALRLPPGHTYSFRVRATDRAGNVGAFATRPVRI